VYSLGAILYELFTGRPPFRADTPLDTVLQVLEREPDRPRLLNPDLDRDLETICLKCLEKDPTRRYGSAEALAEDLECWLAGEPIWARPITFWERALKWARRRPALAALLLVSVLAILGPLMASVWFTARLHEQYQSVQEERDEAQKQQQFAQQQERIARQQEQIAQQRLRQSLYEQGRAERLLRNRQRALEVLTELARFGPSPELRQEAIQTLTTPGLRLLHEIPIGQVSSMKFSADGGVLAIHGTYGDGPPDPRQQQVKIWRMPGGQLLGATRLAGNSFLEGTSWFTPLTMAPFGPSPVSPVCALASEDYTQVRLWDPISDQDLGRVNAHAMANVVFRADGTRIAVLERADPTKLRTGIWNIAAGRWENHLTEGGTPIAFLSDDELIVLVIPQLRRIRIATGQVAWSTPPKVWPMLVSANGRVAALRPDHGRKGDALPIWDLATGKEIASVPGAMPEAAVPYPIQFSPDGERLAFEDPSRANEFKVWERRSGRVREGFKGVIQGGGSQTLFQRGAFSPYCDLLVSYADKQKNVLYLWDLVSGKRVATLADCHSPVWSGDGRMLATIGPGRAFPGDRAVVRVWEVHHPPAAHDLPGPVGALAFDPAGRRLAVNDTVLDVRPDPLPRLVTTEHRLTGGRTLFTGAGQLSMADYPRAIDDPKEFRLVYFAPHQEEIRLRKPVLTPGQPGDAIVKDGVPVLLPIPSGVALSADGRRLVMICQVLWKVPAGGHM
jgi:WD40 repeat protein